MFVPPPPQPLLLPQATDPAAAAANATVIARQSQFFIFISPYFVCTPVVGTQTPLLFAVPGPQVIVGVLLFEIGLEPPQPPPLPQPMAQPAAAAKAIADMRKIFIRPPVYSAALCTV